MGSSSSSSYSPSDASSHASSYSDVDEPQGRRVRSTSLPPSLETAERRLRSLLGRRPVRTRNLLKAHSLLSENVKNSGDRLRLVEGALLPLLLAQIQQFSNLSSEEESGGISRRDSGLGESGSCDSPAIRATKHSPPSSASTFSPSLPGSGRLEIKGVGYGIGSTKSQWDIDRVVGERMHKEHKLSMLLKMLASILDVGPGEGDSLPSTLRHLSSSVAEELVFKSCLVPLLTYHLRNDSVFDVSQHVGLYQAIVDLLFVMISSPEVLLQLIKAQGLLLTVLLPRFQSTLNSYPATLGKQHSSGDLVFLHFIERVGQLTEEVHQQMQKLIITGIEAGIEGDLESEAIAAEEGGAQEGSEAASHLEGARRKDRQLEALYKEALENYQMRSYKLLNDAGKPVYGYTYRREVRSVNPESPSHRDRTRRIAKELASMHNALPLSISNSIFVCMDETRCDVLKVLISGPDDTPYENGLFEFDVWFPQSYPHSPPKCAFLTTSSGSVRFNPNLYTDGKICLSILGTWEGRPEEKWNPLCSLLQVLISIQGLIFVKQPYFNEPGYEKLQGSLKGEDYSRKYNLQIENATLIYAALQQYESPPPHFAEVIRRHFWVKRDRVIEQARRWLSRVAREIQQQANEPQAVGGVDVGLMDGMVMSPGLYRREVRRLIEVFNNMPSPL